MTDLSTGLLAYEGVSFPFGDGTPYMITDFQRGAPTWRLGDHHHPTADVTMPGRDLKDGPVHTLSLAVIAEGDTAAEREANVRTLVGNLSAAWDAPEVRRSAGVVAALTIGGKTTFGRPRQFTPDDSGLWDGVDEPVLSFAAVTELWFGAEQVTRVGLVPEFTGGLPVPAAVPFVLGGGGGSEERVVTVGGSRPTWPEFTIHGPRRDPWIDVPGVGRLELACEIAYDQSVTISTAPWARWILLNGVPFPGVLTGRSARLSDMAMRPGSYRVISGGYDPTATSFLEVRVRQADLSL